MILQAAALAGCASAPEPQVIREPVEVHIAVPVPCAAAPELLAPIEVTPPTFVPTCPPATSGLEPADERRLMAYIHAYRTRLAAWEAHDAECRNP